MKEITRTFIVEKLWGKSPRLQEILKHEYALRCVTSQETGDAFLLSPTAWSRVLKWKVVHGELIPDAALDRETAEIVNTLEYMMSKELLK